MNMEYFLPRRLAICEKQIYSFTPDPAVPLRRGDAPPD